MCEIFILFLARVLSIIHNRVNITKTCKQINKENVFTECLKVIEFALKNLLHVWKRGESRALLNYLLNNKQMGK